MPQVVISGFADEAVYDRDVADPREQLSVFSALGLLHYTPRFVNLSGKHGGNKNVIYLDADEFTRLRELNDEYDMKVSSLGTPIGKSALVEGKPSKGKYKSRQEVMDDLDKAFTAGFKLSTRLLRGFSFYPPEGDDTGKYYQQALDMLGKIKDSCEREGFLYGIEVETGLIGRDGQTVSRFLEDLGSPNVVGVYDGANVHVQGLNSVGEYINMERRLGWMHMKDYEVPCKKAIELDEEGLKHFCPVDVGLVDYGTILCYFKSKITDIGSRLRGFELTNFSGGDVLMELEPHISPKKGGGQFGGHSGPDGMGVALRALTKLLDRAGLDYRLRDYHSIKLRKMAKKIA